MGIYSNCVSLSRKYIEVHGRPNSAKFYEDKTRSGKSFFELYWEVESFVPILEYRLLYRRIEMVKHERLTNMIFCNISEDWIKNASRRI